MLIFVLANAITFAICLAAIRFGGLAERIGGIWLLCNVAGQLLIAGAGNISPTLRVLVDGIYATGLIPLAFYTVSWFIGLMALLECGAFTMQAIYLIQDIPADSASSLLNNVVCAAVTLTLLASTVASCIHRRRQAPTGAAPAAA
jgi:hypothetical protein